MLSREQLDVRQTAYDRYFRDRPSTEVIAAELGVCAYTVAKWIRSLGGVLRTFEEAQLLRHAREGRHNADSVDASHCKRCLILLNVAPVGHDGLCGWCLSEQIGIYYHAPLYGRDGIAPVVDDVAMARREIQGLFVRKEAVA